MKKLLILAAAMVVSLPVSANLIKLDFEVDIVQKNISLDELYDPDETLDYTVFIDSDSIGSFSGSFSDGAIFTSTYFSESFYPKTQYSDDALRRIESSLISENAVAEIGRQFGGEGVTETETFQGIHLSLNRHYEADPESNKTISYKRGLEWFSIIGEGNLLREFDESSFQDYMESLIGNSDFIFSDGYIVSEFFPEEDYGMTTDHYGVTGEATLVDVATVPLPSTLLLFLPGVAGLIAVRRRGSYKSGF